MNTQAIINQTAAYIEEKFAGESSGHDWWHIKRVWQNALSIGRTEPAADLLVVQLGALLHDIADWKFHGGDESVGPRQATEWLLQLDVPEPIIHQVVDIIQHISYKGAGSPNTITFLEGKIVQDADRLDAIGAIGIARAFAYGGYKGREIYNPHISPELHTDFAAYQKNTGPTINHFYEKLLLLKDRMHTAHARKLAEKRHNYLMEFLQQFNREWENTDLLAENTD